MEHLVGCAGVDYGYCCNGDFFDVGEAASAKSFARGVAAGPCCCIRVRVAFFDGQTVTRV